MSYFPNPTAVIQSTNNNNEIAQQVTINSSQNLNQINQDKQLIYNHPLYPVLEIIYRNVEKLQKLEGLQKQDQQQKSLKSSADSSSSSSIEKDTKELIKSQLSQFQQNILVQTNFDFKNNKVDRLVSTSPERSYPSRPVPDIKIFYHYQTSRQINPNFIYIYRLLQIFLLLLQIRLLVILLL